MQKSFIKILSGVIVGAMVLTFIIIFGVQTYSSKSNIILENEVKMQRAIEMLEQNNIDLEELRISLSNDYIIKARAFAYMIQENPKLIEDSSELENIKEILELDQLHVIDENGILRWGTNPEMFGFDFSTNNQTKPFLEALNNKNFELAQNAQPNAVHGELFQYVGVSRYDKKGIVQIGIYPERLDKALKDSNVYKIISDFSVGTNAYMFAVDNTTNKIVSHKNNDYIGKTYEELGLPQNFLEMSLKGAFFKFDNTKKFYTAKEYNGLTIITATDRATLYKTRNNQLVLLFICICTIFAIIIVIINRLLKVKIISGVYSVIDSLNKITAGDLNIIVNVNQFNEFSQLSEGINNMVKSIKSKMNETEILMKNQSKIIENIKAVSNNIADYSHKMNEISDNINDGSNKQQDAIKQLVTIIDNLKLQIDNNASTSLEMNEIADNSKQNLLLGNEDINHMLKAMDNINSTSSEIVNIVSTIDSITSQTSMLALNAAIEAARAGEFGKGFSVVAEQVRKLAGETIEASKNISELIQKSVDSINEGTNIAKQTVNKFVDIKEGFEELTYTINKISKIALEQTDAVNIISDEVMQISSVVQENSETAKQSLDISGQVLEQATNLKQIVIND